MNQIASELRTMGQRLLQLFPEAKSINLDAFRNHGGGADVSVHGVTVSAEPILNRVGIATVRTTPLPEGEAFDGELDGLTVCVFCRESEVVA